MVLMLDVPQCEVSRGAGGFEIFILFYCIHGQQGGGNACETTIGKAGIL
jgi:hypothetical protein